jgi:general secretion pathway protein H
MTFALAQPHRAGEAGVTLIEVLVVLAVIGVAASATMLGLNAADRGTRAGAEAVRLAQYLTLGADEAMLGGRPLALVWNAGGYGFLIWSDEDAAWRAAPGLLAARHDLRAPLELSLRGTDDPVPVLIAPAGVGPARLFGLSGAGPRWVVEFDGFAATARPDAPA